MKPFLLEGRTALVTGASQGIGRAVASCLAARGARVVAAARSTGKLEALVGEIRERGGEAMALTLDLAEPATVADRFASLPEPWDAIDILVNNAGITADGLLARMSLEDWQRVIDTNLTGTFAASKAVARGMMRRKWGRIISVSSVVGLMGNAGQANYAAAKAGLVGFSKSMARELASRNVTVNVVAPGFIETAMTEDLPAKSRDELFQIIPLKRIGSVEDVAWAVLYLASDEGGYVTGHVLNVSGGLYI